MAQVLIRDLDPRIVARLKARARGHRRSLQAELKEILEQAAEAGPRDRRAVMRDVQKLFAGRAFADSTDSIREDRER
jgi:plasmid stability protein